MTNTINTINTNAILTADDLRKLVKVSAIHTFDVVQATEPDDSMPISALIERTKKLHAMSVTMQELFAAYQVVKLDEDTAHSIINELLMDKIGLALALTNLAKAIDNGPKSELSPEEITGINAQEEMPIDISKMAVI